MNLSDFHRLFSGADSGGAGASDIYLSVLKEATGDGAADDTNAINAIYDEARETGRTVFWPRRPYKTTGAIDASGVSTLSDGAILRASLNGGSGAAFGWGGTDTSVCGLIFDLSNIDADVPIQGIYNPINNAQNQRFARNRIIARTRQSSGDSNVFGLWIIGTGLKGLHVHHNYVESTTYGIQYNAQSDTGNIKTKPYGAPSSDIHIHDNTCIDAALGVNTPHIYCRNVFVRDNSVRAVAYPMDIPLNIAHVANLTVTGNTVESNIAGSGDGILHIEDASQAVTVTGNVLKATKAGSTGLFVGVQGGVSGDDNPTDRIVITGNHIKGVDKSGASFGIITNDNQSMNTVITGNHIDSFTTGIANFQEALCVGNTLENCGAAFLGAGYGSLGPNTILNCTQVFGGVGSEQVLDGATITNTALTPVRAAGNGGVLYRGIRLRMPVTALSATATKLFKLPTIATTFKITILLSAGLGYASFSVASTGSAITATAGAKSLPSSVTAITLSRASDGSLAMAVTGSGTTNYTLLIDDLIY